MNRVARPTRRRDGNDETTRLLAPFVELGTGVFGKLHWVMAVLLATYAGSGITVIEANEVGMVLRFGALVGDTPATAVHPPGLMFALPRPMDEVVRVQVDKVHALRIDDLHYADGEAPAEIWTGEVKADSIDPEKEGYVLTADRNVLQTRITARYTVGDPIAYALHVADHHGVLRDAVLEAVVQTTGAIELDDLLGGGRDGFIREATLLAQQRLDGVSSGLKLVSIEFDDLSPGRQVMEEFDAVQSAFIASVTTTEEANRYAAQVVPEAKAEAEAEVRDAKAYAARILGRARSGAAAFDEIVQTYHANPTVVRERLYREGIERALDDGGKVTFVPAPVGGRYTEMRVTIPTSGKKKP